MTLLTAIILLATGVLSGVINSIAGGGGLLVFPVFLATGLSPAMANATDFIATLPGHASSAWGYRKHFFKVPKQYLWLLIPLIIGGLLGLLLFRHSHEGFFDHIAPFLVLSSVLLFALQPRLTKWRRRKKPLTAPHVSRKHIIMLSVIMLAVAIYGGYFGVGLSFAALAFLSYTRIESLHALNGVKNIVSLVVPLLAIGVIAGTGLIVWKYGLLLAAGNLIGGLTGSRVANYMSPNYIRIGAVIIGIATSIYLFWNYFG